MAKNDVLEKLFTDIDYSLLHDINLSKFLFIFIFYVFLETPSKPKIFSEFLKKYPFIKWIFFAYLTLKRDKYIIYVIILIFIYQLFIIIDNINTVNFKKNIQNL